MASSNEETQSSTDEKLEKSEWRRAVKGPDENRAEYVNYSKRKSSASELVLRSCMQEKNFYPEI